MTVFRHDTWNTLLGAVVEVRKNGTPIRTGLVEDVMPDSSALWIAADGLAGRILIEVAEGYEVWVEPKQLKGTRAYRMTWSALHPWHNRHRREDPSHGRLRYHIRTAATERA
ncbi:MULTISPECIES: hypothetical protein [unclassified Arthrobacter]|uniref:hypothetical protein n=1 Tax=unclassified Arthrobacter TaxID=235627 RepID=UPI001C8665DA|nr:hypothetical protein [Arthrobacter sp. MAHUQ-56]MBX7443399.1 hypothetical protein [Arthrobacter sp. MAHUQ-56]